MGGGSPAAIFGRRDQNRAEILQALEENHVMPTLAAQQTNGTLDQTPMWQNGQYAGTFAWDADAETYRSALKMPAAFGRG